MNDNELGKIVATINRAMYAMNEIRNILVELQNDRATFKKTAKKMLFLPTEEEMKYIVSDGNPDWNQALKELKNGRHDEED